MWGKIYFLPIHLHHWLPRKHMKYEFIQGREGWLYRDFGPNISDPTYTPHRSG